MVKLRSHLKTALLLNLRVAYLFSLFLLISINKLFLSTFLQISRYEKYHVHYGGEQEARKANYTDMVAEFLSHFHLFIALQFP